MNVKKKIRHAIRWFLPYGVVRWYAQKNAKVESPRETFMDYYRKYLNNERKVDFSEQSPFETVVSVQGFGFSGSGAVVDLLREYDSALVIGSVDYEGSVSSRIQHCEEVDILRLAGGLFEVERFLNSNNIFQNDALLHRLIAQIENAEIYQKIPKTRQYFYEYLNQICDVLTDSPFYQYYNTYLNQEGNNDILYLKNISQAAYREICRKLLNTLFYKIKGDSTATILVLDQFVNDWEFDMKRYLEYIPNLKLITVHRDIRDVYAFANIKNVEWIPHHSLDVFVKWNNTVYKKYNRNEQKLYCAIQFERLIEEYEKVVPLVEKYLGLDSSMHTRKGTCLDPRVSRKNIQLWKKDINNQEIYMEIKKQLADLCYYND